MGARTHRLQLDPCTRALCEHCAGTVRKLCETGADTVRKLCENYAKTVRKQPQHGVLNLVSKLGGRKAHVFGSYLFFCCIFHERFRKFAT